LQAMRIISISPVFGMVSCSCSFPSQSTSTAAEPKLWKM
jgi:hypothetical protein